MSNTRMPRPALGSLHHVSVQVTDLTAALHFYKDILGLAEVDTPPDILANDIRWLDLGQGRMLHLVQTEDVIPAPRAHFAITVDDVAGWRAYLEANQVEILAPTVAVYGAERFFMRDPSGNLLELVNWPI